MAHSNENISPIFCRPEYCLGPPFHCPGGLFHVFFGKRGTIRPNENCLRSPLQSFLQSKPHPLTEIPLRFLVKLDLKSPRTTDKKRMFARRRTPEVDLAQVRLHSYGQSMDNELFLKNGCSLGPHHGDQARLHLARYGRFCENDDMEVLRFHHSTLSLHCSIGPDVLDRRQGNRPGVEATSASRCEEYRFYPTGGS